MKIYSIKTIVDFMETTCESNKHSSGSYESIAKKYIDICVLECLRGYNNTQDKHTIPFRVQTLKEQITNRYNRSKYWLPVLRDNFPFFYTIKKGFSNSEVSIISSVKPIFSQTDCVAHCLSTDISNAVDCVYPLKQGHICYTPIDQKNLENYIKHTAWGLNDHRYAKGKQTLLSRLNQALLIQTIANQNDGYLPQNYSVKNTGRTYFSGINLQTSSSEVREAALGKCYKYDLRSSMYAHMLSVCTADLPKHAEYTSYIGDYAGSKRSQIRNMLAKECLTNTNADTETKKKLIKGALQAIGFGSSITNAYGAVANVIYHAADRQQLAEHWWIKGLMAEIDAYRQIMKQSYPQAKKLLGEELRKNGRSSLSKWCSYDYQHTESRIIDAVIDAVGEEHLLLQVHDALYFSKPVDRGQLDMIAKSITPHAHFEYEQIQTSVYNGYDQHVIQTSDLEHRHNIEVEEIIARNYENRYV